MTPQPQSCSPSNLVGNPDGHKVETSCSLFVPLCCHLVFAASCAHPARTFLQGLIINHGMSTAGTISFPLGPPPPDVATILSSAPEWGRLKSSFTCPEAAPLFFYSSPPLDALAPYILLNSISQSSRSRKIPVQGGPRQPLSSSRMSLQRGSMKVPARHVLLRVCTPAWSHFPEQGLHVDHEDQTDLELPAEKPRKKTQASSCLKRLSKMSRRRLEKQG